MDIDNRRELHLFEEQDEMEEEGAEDEDDEDDIRMVREGHSEFDF